MPLDALADARLMRNFAYVGGRWTAGEANATFPVADPATGKPIGHVAAITAAQARAATDAAAAAFPAWSTLLPQDRSVLLRRWFGLITEAREDLARLMTREQGKPALRGPRRDRLRRELRRVLRRGSPPPEHRGRDLAPPRRRGRALARAFGRRRADHALELPLRDGHPQGRRRARRRLHRA